MASVDGGDDAVHGVVGGFEGDCDFVGAHGFAGGGADGDGLGSLIEEAASA